MSSAAHYEPIARSYLRLADSILPGRIVGFYLVGSAALGAYRPGRSDLDFVALLDGAAARATLARLRALHLLSAAHCTAGALRRRHSPLTGTCNGVFLAADDVGTPLASIEPVASHTAERFQVGAAFNLNPVEWKTWAERGIRLRGPDVAELGLEVDAAELRAWNVRNLASYWRPWAEQVLGGPGTMLLRARWWTAWGVLGAPRLHCTIATGEVVSKEAAGDYALSVFDSAWHPIIEEGLAYRRGMPKAGSVGRPGACLRRAAEFVLHVVDAVGGTGGAASGSLRS